MGIDHPHSARWHAFDESAKALRGAYFDPEKPIFVARAPGRLDVMGGIADYSGATVLELPIGSAAYCAVQRTSDSMSVARSANAESEGYLSEVGLPIQELLRGESFAGERHWAAYVLGCLIVLNRAGLLNVDTATGYRFYLESDVPIGAGVSSSAAIEVASMTALAGALEIDLDGMLIARRCQRVENEVAGAPCGIMDQVTSALGEADKLLALDCRPHTLLGHYPVPSGCHFVGINSGVKHSVGGSNYTRARISAFIGLSFAEEALNRDLGGYLCNLSVGEWRSIRDRIPAEIIGGEYLERFSSYPDTVTRVEPGERYFPRAAAEHPILENARVRRFIDLIQMEPRREILAEMGSLMLESHRSYSERVQLGSDETDLIVELAIRRGPERGLYGAKITGGGSGGAVAILCSGPHWPESIDSVIRDYARETGLTPEIISASSSGAIVSGVRQSP